MSQGQEDKFKTTCQALNKVLEQQGNEVLELDLNQREEKELIHALKNQRELLNQGTGDAIFIARYNCPSCGSEQAFRAQEHHISQEAEHPGLEVWEINAIATCLDCLTQVDLHLFKSARSEDVDEETWEQLYHEQYQDREKVEKLN